jgi:hypothetical protein
MRRGHHFRHQNYSREVEYGQRNGEMHFINKFEHVKRVPKWSERIHQFLAEKQIRMLEHALYSSCDFSKN